MVSKLRIGYRTIELNCLISNFKINEYLRFIRREEIRIQPSFSASLTKPRAEFHVYIFNLSLKIKV